MQTDLQTGVPLILKAMEKEREERAFLQWVVQLPHMSKENFVSFADYKNKLTGANIDRRSVAEIEHDLAEVEARINGGGGC